MSGDTWISTIDVNDWTQKLFDKEFSQITQISKKKVSVLSQKQTTLSSQVNAYTQLQTLLSTLYTSVQQLPQTLSPTYNVQPSNPTVASASVTGTNVPTTSHSLTINNLATAQTIQSTAYNSATSDLGFTDSITLQVGTGSITVPVGTGDSLQSIANNIMTSASTNNLGVTASVVPVGGGNFQLVVSSTQTGLANAVTITEAGPSNLGLNNPSNIKVPGADASFVFDNMNMTSPTNMNIPISGLSINLLTGGGATTNLFVNTTNQVPNATTAIQNVLNAYNAIDTFVEQTQASTLAPDANLALVLTTLQNTLLGTAGSPPYNSLMNIGIFETSGSPITIETARGEQLSYTPHGQLTLNTNPEVGPILSTVLTNNFSAVQTLLTDSMQGLMNSSSTTSLSSMLALNSGALWKALNSPGTGAIPLANTQISTVKGQIQDEQTRVGNLKHDLLIKYGNLNLALSGMQTQSRYLSQQLALLGNNK